MTVPFFTFVGGAQGDWRIQSIDAIVGPSIPSADRLKILSSEQISTADAVWSFKGVVSNLRYTHRDEKENLVAKQPPLNRAKATCAAMILIKKSEAWWALSQDERRAILEEQSRHIHIGMQYLPAIARRLHHSRDLGEPFDFITWFEFAPEHTENFSALVKELRATKEWEFVEREVDVRVIREPA